MEKGQTKSISSKKTTPAAPMDTALYRTLATEERAEGQEGEVVTRGTSMPKLQPCSCPETRAYTLGEVIGPETRHHQYKSGFKHGAKLLQKREFINIMGRYLCSFLNSGGGVLYFGVDDGGAVRGVQMGAGDRQDLLTWVRLIFTKKITMVNGDAADYNLGELEMYGNLYTVNFAKVYSIKNKGTPKEKREIEENLTVVEICIHPRPDGENYKFMDKTFSRRDASCRFPQDQQRGYHSRE